MSTPSFRRILELLDEHGVEYVIVGGVAAVLNARYREHRDLRPSRADVAAGGHLLLMTDSGPFDVLGFIGGGKRFEDVAGEALALNIGDLNIKVLPLAALIAEKKALARDKDLAVIRLLEAVLSRTQG
jgi:hypothetical protein